MGFSWEEHERKERTRCLLYYKECINLEMKTLGMLLWGCTENRVIYSFFLNYVKFIFKVFFVDAGQ